MRTFNVDIYSAEELANRYNNYSGIDSDALKKYGYIIVDEAQDISPMLWRVLSRKSINKSFTIVGDFAQSSYNTDVNTWDNAVGQYLNAPVVSKHLSINYRTPKEIMHYANEYAKANNIPVSKSKSIKSTPNAVIELEYQSVKNVVDVLLKNITTKGKNALIIEDSNLKNNIKNELTLMGAEFVDFSVEKSTKTLLSNISILTAMESKGLEFDTVIIVKPNIINKNELYVAFTRAAKKLVVFLDK
jgi:DNA helicase IV